MTNRQKIRTLIKRYDHLRDRAFNSVKPLTYDFQEISALAWAIEELCKKFRYDDILFEHKGKD